MPLPMSFPNCGAGSGVVRGGPVGEIEAPVIDQLRAVFQQPEILAGK